MGSFAVRFLPLAIFTLFWFDIKNLIIILFFFYITDHRYFDNTLGERAAFLLFFLICNIFVLLKKFRKFFLIHLIVFLTVFLYLAQNNNIEQRYFGFKKTISQNEFIFFTEEHHSLMLTS